MLNKLFSKNNKRIIGDFRVDKYLFKSNEFNMGWYEYKITHLPTNTTFKGDTEYKLSDNDRTAEVTLLKIYKEHKKNLKWWQWGFPHLHIIRKEVFKIVSLFNVANIKIESQEDFNTAVENIIRKGKTLNEAIRMLLLNRKNIPFAKTLVLDMKNSIKEEEFHAVLIPYVELMADIESKYIYK